MNYITNYWLNLNSGFQCKVNGKTFNCTFNLNSCNKLYFISNILSVADAMEIPRQEFIDIFNSDYISNSVICISKQQCYDLCQHIVNKYFKPDSFIKNDEEFTVEINGNKHKFFLIKNVMFYWDSKTINAFHFNDHISLTEIGNICYILKINKYKHHNNKIGFETKEDAIKFAKYVIQYHYPRKETKECSEKSRRYLTKYYNPTENTVFFPDNSFNLYKWNNEGQWFWRNTSIGSHVLYEQFKLTQNQVLIICNNLNILAFFIANVLIFESTTDAIKFTDYLIETYIIKKEKTYDTNRLRKERTSLSRGVKPAGSIIHGRRSKASVRCRHIEYKVRIGC